MDLTGRNISDYLVKTYPGLIKTRYEIVWTLSKGNIKCELRRIVSLLLMYRNSTLYVKVRGSHSNVSLTVVFNLNLTYSFSFQPEEQILGEWTKVILWISSNCIIVRRELGSCRTTLYAVKFGLYYLELQLSFVDFSRIFSVVSRYGGISVGGQLPVLELQPKIIQDVAAQLGRLLNVTGVCVRTTVLTYVWYNLTVSLFITSLFTDLVIVI